MAFLKAAQRGLAPNGVLWLVANRHLPYHATLTALFREVEDVGGDGTFRVTCARYPIRSRP
jgi:16S rRNA (guanine1207-N2)-methyltransferase